MFYALFVFGHYFFSIRIYLSLHFLPIIICLSLFDVFSVCSEIQVDVTFIELLYKT